MHLCRLSGEFQRNFHNFVSLEGERIQIKIKENLELRMRKLRTRKISFVCGKLIWSTVSGTSLITDKSANFDSLISCNFYVKLISFLFFYDM